MSLNTTRALMKFAPLFLIFLLNLFVNGHCHRWAELSRFLLQVHAPLDTNIVERALKLVIQVRKSSMFYKTLSSAAFASYVQSALYSAAQNEINQCEYMCALIENAQAVIQNPSAWLPWCFKQS